MNLRRIVTATSFVAAATAVTFVAEATSGLSTAPATPQPEHLTLPVPAQHVLPVLPFCDELCRDSATQLALDGCYAERHGLRGQGVDYAAVARRCGQAAKTGNAHAQTLMGELHFLGLGQPQDFVTAADWYARAAVQGHPHAQAMMSEMARLKLVPRG